MFPKNFVRHIVRSRTLSKNGPKNENFKIFFCYFESPYFWLLPRKISSKSEKKFFWLHSGPKMGGKSPKIFFSDFDQILRGNSQKYGDSK